MNLVEMLLVGATVDMQERLILQVIDKDSDHHFTEKMELVDVGDNFLCQAECDFSDEDVVIIPFPMNQHTDHVSLSREAYKKLKARNEKLSAIAEKYGFDIAYVKVRNALTAAYNQGAWDQAFAQNQ